ncbi:TPA: hypothetical protein N0F65_012550 [Lagenidium giganteum]|uniref:Protein kinase domain-containing protein n=1 Tax=Lagenidium giganteum TaxID=4803 RepID=A0AAV2YMJ5_9STRA|nr:TPA: hypothetical protein N0F65_012550 [Lagenidium giganteum]
MLLRERYLLETKLAEGINGIIWQGFDLLRDNEPIVIKQAPSVQRKNLDDASQEKHMVSMLLEWGGHENIVEYLDEFELGSSWFLVMELCEGDLLQRVQASPSGHMLETVSLHCFRQVAQAVHFLHEHDVAHRDLSLENVLVHNGMSKLCDFGLSVPANQVCDDTVGKAYYMAPEVVAEGKYDPMAADMWSLGIMLFIMLTGSPLTPLASLREREFTAFKLFGLRAILDAWGITTTASTFSLLEGLLQVEPSRRLSVGDVIAHPALQGF